MSFLKFFSKEKKESLDKGLEKTKEGFFKKITRTLFGKTTIDDETLDELENILISADVGVETTIKIIKQIEERAKKQKFLNSDELNQAIKEEIASLMKDAGDINDFSFCESHKPYVIMVVGVNGVGKTTTIAKLAYQFKSIGKNVFLGAADTFRAAAIEQLSIWAQRINVPIIKQQMGADPASVAYDTLNSAIKNNADVVIIDTAGRLHNKINLMNELAKIKRVMQKLLPDAPHEILLILDATTGQNAFEQAKQFTAITNVNSICVTKLDGTAKGGVVIGISNQFNIPVKYIGIGEKPTDLQLFNKYAFIDSLFN
jgi:fused signal recognition particle receptor